MTAVALASPIAQPRSNEDRLFEIIKEKSLLKGKDFSLSSGRMSNYFFDMKKTMLDPEGATLIATTIFTRIAALRHSQHRTIDAIGGLEMGAVPIVSVVCAQSFETKEPLPGFFVRKSVKGHGTNQIVDGQLNAGMHVILVDDVTTTAGSVKKAIQAVRQARCTVDTVLTVVDRLEGAREALAAEEIDLIALFTRDDFSDADAPPPA